MPDDFLANDFETIARSVRPVTLPTPAVLHFRYMLSVLTSLQESVEAAVQEAYSFGASNTRISVLITATNGIVLVDNEELAEAVNCYRDGMAAWVSVEKGDLERPKFRVESR